MLNPQNGSAWHAPRSNTDRKMSVFSRKRAARGFTLVELLVAMAILAIVAAVVIPRFYVTLKRQKLMSPVREMYSLVLATRMQAVRRNQWVILKVDLTDRRIYTWADSLPYNFIQDAGEPTLNSYQVPSNIVFQFAPDGVTDGLAAVAFDEYPDYPGGAAITNEIIFKGDGTLVPPRCGYCQLPLLPSAYTPSVPYGSVNCQTPNACRGIYLAENDLSGDVPNRNVFRIGVDDIGRVTLLKWIPTTGVPGGNGGERDYVVPPWNWVN